MRVISRCVIGLIWVLIAALMLCVAGCGRQETAAPDAKAQHEAGKSKKLNTPKAVPEEESGPTLELKQQGVTLTWMEKNQIRMSATVKEIKWGDSTRVCSVINFSGKLYDNGKLTATLSAPKAVVDTTKRIVTATGRVTLKSMERNTTVNAGWMKWYEKEQKVVGDGGVKIDSKMGKDVAHLQGAAFTADTAMKDFTIMDSAKGL